MDVIACYEFLFTEDSTCRVDRTFGPSSARVWPAWVGLLYTSTGPVVILTIETGRNQYWQKKQVRERGSAVKIRIVPALESHPAVGVPLALGLAAGDGVGVGREAVLASADGVPSLHAASGSRAARCRAAWVGLWRSQDSGVGILVRLTAAVDWARKWDESGDTLAYRVALRVIM